MKFVGVADQKQQQQKMAYVADEVQDQQDQQNQVSWGKELLNQVFAAE